MVKEARFRDKRECLRRRAEPRLADRAILTGTIYREGGGEAPFEALYPAAAPRAYRRTFPTTSEHRCALASSRRCLLLDDGHPPQHRPDIVDKRFTGQRSAVRRGRPMRGGSSGERGEGITEAARGWVAADVDARRRGY